MKFWNFEIFGILKFWIFEFMNLWNFEFLIFWNFEIFIFSISTTTKGWLFLRIDIFCFSEFENLKFLHGFVIEITPGVHNNNGRSGAPGGVEIRFSSNWAYRLRGEEKETHNKVLWEKGYKFRVRLLPLIAFNCL